MWAWPGSTTRNETPVTSSSRRTCDTISSSVRRSHGCDPAACSMPRSSNTSASLTAVCSTAPRAGRTVGVADDDDWVGEPPEGRYTRDRAKPGFWANQWQPLAIGGGVLVVLVIVVLILALA